MKAIVADTITTVVLIDLSFSTAFINITMLLTILVTISYVHRTCTLLFGLKDHSINEFFMSRSNHMVGFLESIYTIRPT